jgi:hypothetical protein
MPHGLRFHCARCGARIKAPVQLAGQYRDCPRCHESFVVPRLASEDCGCVLVPLEASAKGASPFAPRRSA